jgi:hypothetical protein
MDLRVPSLEINCSASRYDLAKENPAWENGTAIKVFGWLAYPGNPPAPRVYLSGGAGGVEVLG